MAKSETEIAIIFKLGNAEGLKEAVSSEKQEQHELFLPGKGRVRIRKTVNESGETLVLTMKPKGVLSGGIRSNAEEDVVIQASAFEVFKNSFADKSFVKDRYFFDGKHSIIDVGDNTFNLPAPTYEVDIFTRFDGTQSVWGKIDVEIQDLLEAAKNIPEMQGKVTDMGIKVSHLPFVPQEAFIISEDMTPEQKALVAKLYDTEWPHNPKGGPMTPVEPSTAATQQVAAPEAGEQQETTSEEPAGGNQVEAGNGNNNGNQEHSV